MKFSLSFCLVFLFFQAGICFDLTQVNTEVGPCEPFQLQWSGGESPFELDVGIPDQINGGFITTRFFTTSARSFSFSLATEELGSSIVLIEIFDNANYEITTGPVPVNNNDCPSSPVSSTVPLQTSASVTTSSTVHSSTTTVFRITTLSTTATVTTALVSQSSSASNFSLASTSPVSQAATTSPTSFRAIAKKKVPPGTIAGAALGGLIVLLLVIFLLYFLIRRRTLRAESVVEPFRDTVLIPRYETISVKSSIARSKSDRALSESSSQTPRTPRTPLNTSPPSNALVPSPVAEEAPTFIAANADSMANRIQEIQRMLTQLEQETRAGNRRQEGMEPSLARSSQTVVSPPAYENRD